MGERKFKTLYKEYPLLMPPLTILSGYRGSIAHGMYIPQNNPDSIDDKDVMVIIIPQQEYYYSFKEWGSRGTKEIFKDEWDIVIYELRKFVMLLAKGNPNVLSLLWLNETHYIEKTKLGQMLIDNRNLFATKQAYHAFVGYAHGQLHRMTHYRFEGYMGEKRKALVDRFGYDTKNAAHLIRLLRMGIEFMNDGYLYVQRKDSPQLLEIKKGEWTLEQVKAEAGRLFGKAEDAYTRSKLPIHPNMDLIHNLCVDICNIRFGCWLNK